ARRRPSTAASGPPLFTWTATPRAAASVNALVRPWRTVAREPEARQRTSAPTSGTARRTISVIRAAPAAGLPRSSRARGAPRRRPAGRDRAHRRASADAREHAGDHPRLDHDDDRGDEEQRAPVGEQADGARQRGQQQRLRDEEPPPGRPALPPDDQQRDDQAEEREEVRDGRHQTRTTAMTERIASANEPASSSGTRKRRSFATVVSSTASAIT